MTSHSPMITSAREPVRYQPVADHPAVFLIKVPTLFEREALRRDLMALGARMVREEELFEAMRAGVAALIVPEDQPRALELIDLTDAVRQGHMPAETLKDHTEQMAFLEAELARKYPPFAALWADRDYYLSLLPWVSAARFITGVEGVDGVDLKRDGRGHLTDESLKVLAAATSEGHVMAAGYKALELARVTRGQEKNSSPPSTSGQDPVTSPVDGARRTADQAGSSTAKSGRKTPASRSRKTSGR